MKGIFSKQNAKIFMLMAQIGMIGFGGGNALIPVMQEILVERERIVLSEEFGEDVVIASITPGALPVEIAGGVGARVSGWCGMLAGAIGMALPGAVLTILLSVLSSFIDGIFVEPIKYISLGVIAFILCLLTEYIVKTLRMADQNQMLFFTGTILLVFFLTGGKGAVRLLGITGIPLPGVDTIHIFIMTFFCMFYIYGDCSAAKVMISAVVCLMYVAGIGMGKREDLPYFLYGVSILMSLLSIYGVASHQDIGKGILDRGSYKETVSEMKALFIFAAICSIPAILGTDIAIRFLCNGFLSSVMSFGGGDAYLTVADGLFVGTGMIDTDLFYGNIVPTVNLLPGSILCKTLSAVGYYAGWQRTGSYWAAVWMAVAGFACSIMGSCITFSVMKYIYGRFGRLTIFELIRKFIRPLVSGLMLTVMVSLIGQGKKVFLMENVETSGLMVLLVVFAADCILHFWKKWKNVKTITVSVLLSLFICNVLTHF